MYGIIILELCHIYYVCGSFSSLAASRIDRKVNCLFSLYAVIWLLLLLLVITSDRQIPAVKFSIKHHLLYKDKMVSVHLSVCPSITQLTQSSELAQL